MKQHLLGFLGSRFGKLTVIDLLFSGGNGQSSKWLCMCECGNKSIASKSNLLSGRTNSCGCLRQGVNQKHGHAKHGNGKQQSRTYKTWDSMIQRCYNPNHKSFAYYGGRGIVTTKRWLCFDNFIADMGERPLLKTLERKNNSKGYSKRNCTWATYSEQARNRRTRRSF